jgi:iron(III) transport system ATP-binding protein
VLSSEFRGRDVLLTVDAGGAQPITVRQHGIDPPAVDAKVRVDVIGTAAVLDERP